MPTDTTNHDDIAWYVVNTYAGQENRVKENLEKRIKTMGLEDSLFDIVVAEETETEYKNGKEIKKTHNMFSGYILVKMRMTNEAWYIVRNTPGVTGFIGSSGKGAKPFPVSQEEVDAVLKRLHRESDTVDIDLIPGDYAKVIDGALEDKIVKVISIDPSTRTIKASYQMLGQTQESDFSYSDLQKIENDD